MHPALGPHHYARLSLLLCVFSLGFAYGLSYVAGLTPCILCTVQRGVLIALSLCFVVSSFTLARVIAMLITGLALSLVSIGLLSSARQVYLQWFADKNDLLSCGPDLTALITYFPWRDALVQIFKGSSHCADIQWTFLGLSIPAWSLVIFIIIAVLNVRAMMCLWQRRTNQ